MTYISRTIDNWLSSHFDVIYTGSGHDARINCPFCGTDKGQHLYVELDGNRAHCFRCDWVGTHISLIMQYSKCAYYAAVGQLKDSTVTVSPFYMDDSNTYTVTKVAHPPGYISLQRKPTGLEGKVVLNYLRKRGIPIDYIKRCMGYVPGTMRAWIIADINWYQGRSVTDSKPKYVSPEWPKDGALWNGQALYLCSDITICEGVFSSIHAGTVAVGLCSKTATYQQIQRIARSPVKGITIMLDAGAHEESIRLALELRNEAYSGKLYIHSLYSGDPCDSLNGNTQEFTLKYLVEHKLRTK